MNFRLSPRTGRPPKDESKKKVVRLQIRLTDEESAKLTALAEKLNLSKTDTIIKAIELLAEQKSKRMTNQSMYMQEHLHMSSFYHI